MRTWSDVTKAYSATAMSLLQESSTRDDKASHRVLAYVCLRASCSLRTHVRTVTFRRFTRRDEYVSSLREKRRNCSTVARFPPIRICELVRIRFSCFHTRFRGIPERETHRSSSLIITKGEFTFWEESLWSTWRARYESLIWIYDSRCDWWKSDGSVHVESFSTKKRGLWCQEHGKKKCSGAKRTKVPRYFFAC